MTMDYKQHVMPDTYKLEGDAFSGDYSHGGGFQKHDYHVECNVVISTGHLRFFHTSDAEEDGAEAFITGTAVLTLPPGLEKVILFHPNGTILTLR